MAYPKGYRPSAQTKKNHKERMEKSESFSDLESEVEEAHKSYNASGDPLVVLGSQLAEIMQRWRKVWLAERDPNLEREWEGKVSKVYGPTDWLVEHTGIHARRIRGMFAGEFKTVSYAQAELILIAIDQEYLLDNGTLQVIPNPNWSFEKWTKYMGERGCI